MMISALSPENDPDRKNIYINIQEKNEQEDVVFFLLTTVAKHFGSSMEELLQQIKKCSILPNWENITTFEEYQTALSNFITTKQEELPNKDVKNIVLTSEGMSYYQMMGNLLSQQGKSSVFLFFDHIDTLSPEEQQRINTLISTR
jgi:ERCC4-related helicase